MSEITVAVVGCGVIGPTHIESYQKVDGVRVKWVCDLIEERASRRGDEFSIEKRTTDVEDVLADPDVDIVSICTDHASHADIAVAAFEAGKHVLCEKALGATVEDLDRMVAAHAAHPDLTFGGIFQHRFDTLCQHVKKLVETEALGTLLSCSLQMSCLRTNQYYNADAWRGTWEGEGGSVMINQAIHFVDIVDWIGGGIHDIKAIWANRTHQGIIETEDTAVAAVTYKNGALGTIEATSSSLILKWEPRVSLRGSDGVVEFTNSRVQRVLHVDEARQKELEDELRSCKDEQKLANVKNYYGEGHPANVADFVDAVREGREPFITGESARRAVDIVLRMYER